MKRNEKVYLIIYGYGSDMIVDGQGVTKRGGRPNGERDTIWQSLGGSEERVKVARGGDFSNVGQSLTSVDIDITLRVKVQTAAASEYELEES